MNSPSPINVSKNGDITAWWIPATNLGSGVATNVEVTLTVTPLGGLSVETFSPARGTFNIANGKWYIPHLNPGETIYMRIDTKVIDINLGPFDITSVISGTNIDPNNTNNTKTQELGVVVCDPSAGGEDVDHGCLCFDLSEHATGCTHGITEYRLVTDSEVNGTLLDFDTATGKGKFLHDNPALDGSFQWKIFCLVGVGPALEKAGPYTYVVDKILSEEFVETLGGVIEISHLTEVTYAQLVTLIGGNDLIPGKDYLITDYQTVHDIVGTTDVYTAPIEPLVVKALSGNKLASVAYSTTYPKDILYYNVTNGNLSYPGSTKGYIYRRIDTDFNNDIGFDFRNVVNRRYKIDQLGWSAVTNYPKGAVVKRTFGTVSDQKQLYVSVVDNNLNNIVTSTSHWLPIGFENESYNGVYASTWNVGSLMTITTNPNDYQDKKFFTQSYNNQYRNNYLPCKGLINSTVGAQFNNNTLYESFNDNVIGNGMIYNTITDTFSNNLVFSIFHHNRIGGEFFSNFIYDSFYGNHTEGKFESNIIGSLFNNNQISIDYLIAQGFSRNVISNEFRGNYVELRIGFYDNIIGNLFRKNHIIGDSFSVNVIGNSFINNRIHSEFNENTVPSGMNKNEVVADVTAIDFTTATHVVGSYNCVLYTDATSGLRLRYVNAGVDTFVLVTA